MDGRGLLSGYANDKISGEIDGEELLAALGEDNDSNMSVFASRKTD